MLNRRTEPRDVCTGETIPMPDHIWANWTFWNFVSQKKNNQSREVSRNRRLFVPGNNGRPAFGQIGHFGTTVIKEEENQSREVSNTASSINSLLSFSPYPQFFMLKA